MDGGIALLHAMADHSCSDLHRGGHVSAIFTTVCVCVCVCVCGGGGVPKIQTVQYIYVRYESIFTG